MDVNVEFERREPVATVALASPLNLKDVSLTMERLRSWAGVRSVAVAGTAFLRVTGDAECSVHLPLVSATEPHPETRIEAVDVPAADLAIVRANDTDGKREQFVKPTFDDLGGVRDQANRPIPDLVIRWFLSWWKDDFTGAVELEQQGTARHVFGPSIRRLP